MLEKSVKMEIEKELGRHEKDTGSPEVQIGLLTKRIEALNQHFKIHRKDTNSRRGFLKLIGRRRRLLRYLQLTAPDRYQEVVKKLGLRK